MDGDSPTPVFKKGYVSVEVEFLAPAIHIHSSAGPSSVPCLSSSELCVGEMM